MPVVSTAWPQPQSVSCSGRQTSTSPTPRAPKQTLAVECQAGHQYEWRTPWHGHRRSKLSLTLREVPFACRVCPLTLTYNLFREHEPNGLPACFSPNPLKVPTFIGVRYKGQLSPSC